MDPPPPDPDQAPYWEAPLLLKDGLLIFFHHVYRSYAAAVSLQIAVRLYPEAHRRHDHSFARK